jgi:ferredoxin
MDSGLLINREVRMKIRIDEIKCVGAGICVIEEPQVFRFREGSKQAMVLMPEIPAKLQGKLRAIAMKCPNQAVIVEEDDGTVWQGRP